jgi:hypothetical protein
VARLRGRVARESPQDDAGPPCHLRTQDQREQRHRKPRPKVRSDPPDPSVIGQVKHHRVAHPQRPDPTVADQETAPCIAKLLPPPEPCHAPVHGGQKHAEILLASKDRASGEGRHELGIGCQQVQQRFAGRRWAGHGLRATTGLGHRLVVSGEMPPHKVTGHGDRRAVIAAGVGLTLTAAAIASDFVIGSFWDRHAMLTSLVASLLVVVISIAVVNEVIERRDRRRWSLLAQGVLFALVQSARVTWTSFVELLRLTEVHSGALESLLEGARVALDAPAVSTATRELLADTERRRLLQEVVARLSTHASEVIATWATVLVGAKPYAELLNGHVELQGRLEWLSAVLAHNEPAPDGDDRGRRLNRASIAAELADQIDDDWIHDMVVSITTLATRLDYDSRELAYSLVSADWWTERTHTLSQT